VPHAIRKDIAVFQKGHSLIPTSTPTEQAGALGLSPHEAFVALLIASAGADESVSAHEASSIEHIVAGMHLFRAPVSAEQLTQSVNGPGAQHETVSNRVGLRRH
jgi:hypothetical protein